MIDPLIKDHQKLRLYYATAILSLIFAVVGFSYNAWRLEVSEDNNTVRTASFSVLTLLAELEQNIFAAHYDNDPVAGSSRTGWVKVGLITDLSVLISDEVATETDTLKALWQQHWEDIPADRTVVNTLTSHIDEVRYRIKQTLAVLQ